MSVETKQIVKGPEADQHEQAEGAVRWKSPSNIALVKYWGKKQIQIPCNPSVSFTLDNASTDTTLEFQPKKSAKTAINFYLDDEPKPDFIPKIEQFLTRIEDWCPFVVDYDFTIRSTNTFPHSAGIASSASGMSALALCLCSMEQKISGELNNKLLFYQKASFLARLGSGSACRSIYGGLVAWGETPHIDDASDLYGVHISQNVHEVFHTFKDTILIVDDEEKKVSSSVGHGLMGQNPFSEKRFQQADQNLSKLLHTLENGEELEFISIVESEALTLHAMMMTSSPYYLLMRPNTLKIIEKIFAFRNETKVPLGFTLDAGPNVHLLYAENHEKKVQNFIDEELKQFLHDFCSLSDQVGRGPENIIV